MDEIPTNPTPSQPITEEVIDSAQPNLPPSSSPEPTTLDPPPEPVPAPPTPTPNPTPTPPPPITTYQPPTTVDPTPIPEPEVIPTPLVDETPILEPPTPTTIYESPSTEVPSPPAPILPRSSSSELTTGYQPPTTIEPEPEVIPTDKTQDSTVPSPVATPPTPNTIYQPPTTTEPIDINQLSNDQLKAAAALYTKRNQAEISRKGVAKRKETMELNLREIVDFLSLNNGSPLPRIAKHTNITPGTTSKYLRQLMAKGKVRADGWGKTRRYFLK